MKTKFVTVGIRVKDLQKSIDFYVKLLGMKIVGRGKLEETKGEWVELVSEKDGIILELSYYEAASPYHVEYLVSEGLDHLTFKVNTLNEALEKIESAGYPVKEEQEEEKFRWAYVVDPNGIWVQFY